MLVIRKIQIDQLSELLLKKFEDNAALHIANKHSVVASKMQQKEIREFIRQTIKKAASFNIKEEKDVIRFIDYQIVLGIDFEKKQENEWAKKILLIRNLDGAEKIKRMLKKFIP